MNGVPAKVAKEILMLFKDQHIHASPRQDQSQHDPTRTATSNATRSAIIHGMLDVYRLPRSRCERSRRVSPSLRDPIQATSSLSSPSLSSRAKRDDSRCEWSRGVDGPGVWSKAGTVACFSSN